MPSPRANHASTLQRHAARIEPMARLPSDSLRKGLAAAGFSKQAVSAAWPRWWSAEAEASTSARAELRFALARNLGLSPKALLGERVEFVWRDSARFKNLGSQTTEQQAAITSFGTAVGRSLIKATYGSGPIAGVSAQQLRMAILGSCGVVDLHSLLATCWSVGVPVAHLHIVPLEAKLMHAMVIGQGSRQGVLLARDASYPAPIAFTLAHEIGHVALNHLGSDGALIDAEDPATSAGTDPEEAEADRYALELLTGTPEPVIITSKVAFSGRQLAAAAIAAGSARGIEPGTLALCAGYQTGKWPAAMAALKYIYPGPAPVGDRINRLAGAQLDWAALGADTSDHLRAVLGLADD